VDAFPTDHADDTGSRPLPSNPWTQYESELPTPTTYPRPTSPFTTLDEPDLAPMGPPTRSTPIPVASYQTPVIPEPVVPAPEVPVPPVVAPPVIPAPFPVAPIPAPAPEVREETAPWSPLPTPETPVTPSAPASVPPAWVSEPAQAPVPNAWGSLFGSETAGVSEIDAVLQRLHQVAEPPVPAPEPPAPQADFLQPDAAESRFEPWEDLIAPAEPVVPVEPEPEPQPRVSFIDQKVFPPEPEEPVSPPEPDYTDLLAQPDPVLPEIKVVTPVVPSADTGLAAWSAAAQNPLPDSIFRIDEPGIEEPPLAPPPAVVANPETSVIVSEKTPAELNRQNATRDRKALTIVLSLAVIMAGIVVVALLLVFL